MKYVISIVPGAPSGIATKIGDAFDSQSLPAADGDLIALLRHLQWSAELNDCKPRCVVELTEPLRFAEAGRTGFILGAAEALGFQVVRVRREEWQAGFRRHPAWRGLRPREFNRRLLQAATHFFRSCKVSPGTAEALTLLLWDSGRADL